MAKAGNNERGVVWRRVADVALKVPVTMIFVASVGAGYAAEINGTVRSVTDKYATVASESDLVPAPGDKAEIFFKMPGADDEISVANGHVYEITGANIMIEVDKASGAVANDQLVRINSPNPKKKETLTASPPATGGSIGAQITDNGKSTKGALVRQVAPASPAAVAGVQPNDRIVAVDGSPVENAQQLSALVARLSPGSQHDFLISRENRQQKVKVLIGQRPAEMPSSALSAPLEKSRPGEASSAAQKLIGAWQGGRHRIQYLPDGTLLTDAHLVPNAPPIPWRIAGDRLTEYYSDGKNISVRIVSIDDHELVTQDDAGNTYRSTRLSDADARERANW
jgi:membrane-associated protease RseP (regulator of RpoE activity)